MVSTDGWTLLLFTPLACLRVPIIQGHDFPAVLHLDGHEERATAVAGQ